MAVFWTLVGLKTAIGISFSILLMNHMPRSGSTTAHTVGFTPRHNASKLWTLTVNLSVPGGSEDYFFACELFPIKLHIFLRLVGTFDPTFAEKLCSSPEAWSP